MYGVFLAKSLGAITITFGTHVTPLPRGTMEPYPALDYALRGEPELTLRELVDTLESGHTRTASTAVQRAISLVAPGARLRRAPAAPLHRHGPGMAPRLANQLAETASHGGHQGPRLA